MFCPHCGVANDDNNYRCTDCGEVIQPPAQPVVTSGVEDNGQMSMLLPVGRSPLSIVAGYAGLFALLVFPAPLALVLGLVAMADLKKHPEKRGMGRAVFAVVSGALGTLVLVWLLARS